MDLILTKNHELLGKSTFVCSENKAEILNIKVRDTELWDKWCYIEFEKPGGEKLVTERISIVDGVISYPIVNSLCQCPSINFQVIFRNEENFIWKSFIKKIVIVESINAAASSPEEFADFITEGQKILDSVESVVENEAERVANEEARISNENTRVANEAERINAETERQQGYEEMWERIKSVTGLDIEVVETLPEVGESRKIYLTPCTHGVKNVYDEYLYVNNEWEKIGNTDVDLSQYATTSYVSEQVTNLSDRITEANQGLEHLDSTKLDVVNDVNTSKRVYGINEDGTQTVFDYKEGMKIFEFDANSYNLDYASSLSIPLGQLSSEQYDEIKSFYPNCVIKVKKIKMSYQTHSSGSQRDWDVYCYPTTYQTEYPDNLYFAGVVQIAGNQISLVDIKFRLYIYKSVSPQYGTSIGIGCSVQPCVYHRLGYLYCNSTNWVLEETPTIPDFPYKQTFTIKGRIQSVELNNDLNKWTDKTLINKVSPWITLVFEKYNTNDWPSYNITIYTKEQLANNTGIPIKMVEHYV